MDSAAIAWWRRPELAVFVDYGQLPAEAERRAAEAIAQEICIPLETVTIDCTPLGAGQLVGGKALPQAPTPEWWPYRNQLLITMAAAVVLRRAPGIDKILIGSVLEDGVNADGGSAFRTAMDTLLRLQEGSIGVDAPAAHLSAAQLVRQSQIPASVLGWTHSCFVSNTPCLRCRGCAKHLGILSELGQRWPATTIGDV
jgi:7-cyano-7-deazaguanine synthase